MSLGIRIKSLREKKRLTRKELAEKLNITYHALSKYETDQRNPDYVTLEKLSTFFHITIESLLDIKSPPQNDSIQYSLDHKIIAIIRHLSRKSWTLNKLIQTSSPIKFQESNHYEFPPEIINILEIESEGIKNLYDLDFKLVPEDLEQVIRETDDYDLKREFYHMLVRVSKKRSLNIEQNSEENATSTNKDFAPQKAYDITHDLEKVLSLLSSSKHLTFYGQSMNNEDKELFLISLQSSISMAKKMIGRNKFPG